MAKYTDLLAWATNDKGVQMTGIAPKQIRGAGLGIVATKDIHANEVILKIPVSALRTVDTVPKSISSKLPKDITVHGLLAADIALDPTDAYSVWKAAFPLPSTFQSCMPLLWPSSIHSSLPLAARRLMEKQGTKLQKDWQAISSCSSFPNLSREDYTYAWLLVNTRTFYYATPKHKAKLSNHDHLALLPIADLFNHSSHGCHVGFDTKPVANGTPAQSGFTMTADRDYKQGQEVTISYNRHGNDSLLVEYGFCLDGASNEWDEVCIDEAILPHLTSSQAERLAEYGFHGDYVLDGRTPVCYRTEMAVRAMVLDEEEWTRIAEGRDGGETSQRLVDRTLINLLSEWGSVMGMKPGVEGDIASVLEDRWHQIVLMVRASCAVLIGRI